MIRFAHASLVVSTALFGLGFLAAGCGGGGHSGGFFIPTTPTITSINGSTNPSTPTNVTMEVNGTGFGTVPGTVRFVQGGTTVNVTPTTSGAWTNTSILVLVPATLTAPGTATVTVITAAGTSNPATINLVVAPNFSPSNQVWTNAPALPQATRAEGAVSVLASSTQTAYVYVIGGNNGVANVTTVLVATVTSAGAVSAWTATNPLPAARAFPAVAEADPTVAPVATGTAYLYVIGGQQTASDAPGGTNTVYVGTVTLSTGAVTWAANPTALPETRLAAQAVVANGFIYVTGGLSATGTPITAVASAPINANGTLGAFTETGNGILPASGTAFHQSFAFGGFLYDVGGDSAATQTPFVNGAPTTGTATFYAPIRDGVVGTWAATAGQPNKSRSKFAVVQSFGQLAIYEGLYNGNAGSSEGEVSSVAANGNLNSFNGLTGANAPGLNTYNLAGVTTPLVTSGTTTKPIWLLIGGDIPATPGSPVATVKQGP